MYELRPSTPELLEPPKTWSLASILSKCFKPVFQVESTCSSTALPFQETSHHILKPNFSPKQHPHTSYPPTTWNIHYPQGYLWAHLTISLQNFGVPKFPHSPLHRLSLNLQLATNGVFETHQGQQGQWKSRGWNTHHLNKISRWNPWKIPTNWQPSHKKIRSNLWSHVKSHVVQVDDDVTPPCIGESLPHHRCSPRLPHPFGSLAALWVAFGMKLANIVKVASLRVPVRSSS